MKKWNGKKYESPAGAHFIEQETEQARRVQLVFEIIFGMGMVVRRRFPGCLRHPCLRRRINGRASPAVAALRIVFRVEEEAERLISQMLSGEVNLAVGACLAFSLSYVCTSRNFASCILHTPVLLHPTTLEAAVLALVALGRGCSYVSVEKRGRGAGMVWRCKAAGAQYAGFAVFLAGVTAWSCLEAQ